MIPSATRLSRQRRQAQSTASYHNDNENLPPHSHKPPVMSASTASSDNDVRSRNQQSPLASRRAKEQSTDGSGATRKSRFDGLFPLGYKEGFSQWWSNIPAAQAEHKVLSYVPYLQQPPTQTSTYSAPLSETTTPASLDQDAASRGSASALKRTDSLTDPYGPRTWYSHLVPLPGKNRAVNEFSVVHTDDATPASEQQNLVLLHGYGAGLGFFYKNFEALSRPRGWHLYALDLLGMGRSSRPPFKLKAKDRKGQIAEAEAWFVDSLEEWRVQKKIDKFTLLGHSMGGYMAVAYALKYPGRLNKLILASPVGIPEDPYAVNADMPEPPGSTMANEFTQDQDTESTRSGQKANPNRLPATNDKSTPRKPLSKWVTYLWDANISPFSFVRWAGPLGPRLVSGWTSRRFSHLPHDEAQALHDYAYSLFRLRGSGEYALAYILAPGAFARSPLIRRIGGVGRQPLPSTMTTGSTMGAKDSAASAAPAETEENGTPVILMYGENDWMDVAGGYAAKKQLDEEKEKALVGKSREERERDQGSAKVVIIKRAGHHVYLDGWEEFNDFMLGEMKDTSRRAKMALQERSC